MEVRAKLLVSSFQKMVLGMVLAKLVILVPQWARDPPPAPCHVGEKGIWNHLASESQAYGLHVGTLPAGL